MPTGCAIILAIVRFEKKLELCEHGCRVWTGAQTRGGKRKGAKRGGGGGPYGKFWIGPGKKDTAQAHVFAAFLAGKITSPRVPDGMHLDHDCHCNGTLCVDCTELVPAAINLERRHTRPQPKVDRPPPGKPKRRKRRAAKQPGNSKKLHHREKELLTAAKK